ncbi:MAG: NMD3-related protein [Nanoarchaeota archaeon]|nr:NMD3-related protein [Nanoarchaeota archaeon]
MECVKCGKPVAVESFCKECYLKRNPLFLSNKDLIILVCIDCRKILNKGTWHFYKDINAGIKKVILSRLKLKHAVKASVELKLPAYQYKPGVKTKGSALIQLILEIDQGLLEENHELPLTVEFTTCPICSKKGTTYFEGVLQIRNPNDKIIDFISKAISKRQDIHISKTVELKTGVDFYLSSNKFLQIFSKKLFHRFGGEFKVSTKLFTRNKQTGKNVYRANVLLRLTDFKVGDIVSIKKQLILVKDIRGHNLYGVDVMTGRLTSADYHQHDYEIACYKKDIQKTTVSTKYPHIEIIHPETYQSVNIKNKRDVQPGEKVKVAIIDDYVYLV